MPTSRSSSPRNTLAVTRSPLSKRARRRCEVAAGHAQGGRSRRARRRGSSPRARPGRRRARSRARARARARERATPSDSSSPLPERAALPPLSSAPAAARSSSAMPNSASSSFSGGSSVPRTALAKNVREIEAADLGREPLEAVLGNADAARAIAAPELAHDVVERRAARGV